VTFLLHNTISGDAYLKFIAVFRNEVKYERRQHAGVYFFEAGVLNLPIPKKHEIFGMK
jgi:hypothetical protein